VTSYIHHSNFSNRKRVGRNLHQGGFAKSHLVVSRMWQLFLLHGSLLIYRPRRDGRLSLRSVLGDHFVVFHAFKELQIYAARFIALMWWIMAISVSAIMHQYAKFQVTKIGGRERDVLSHACQLPPGCLDPLIQPACPWCLSTTQLTMGGKKRTASYFQFGPRCPSPEVWSTWMWSVLAQLRAFSTTTTNNNNNKTTIYKRSNMARVTTRASYNVRCS